MAVDPVDDCTFWYTQEYIEITGTAPWQTRIAAFKFPSCTQGPSGTVEGTVTNAATMLPIAGATVEVGRLLDLNGWSRLLLHHSSPRTPTTSPRRSSASRPRPATGVVVTDGMTTTQDFALTPVGQRRPRRLRHGSTHRLAAVRHGRDRKRRHARRHRLHRPLQRLLRVC